MLYAIISTDVENSLPKRKQARTSHIARLKLLKKQGRLVLAGPHPLLDRDYGNAGFSGSLVVAEFDSLQVAQDWAAKDPYLESGAYESFVVKPFKQVLL